MCGKVVALLAAILKSVFLPATPYQLLPVVPDEAVSESVAGSRELSISKSRGLTESFFQQIFGFQNSKLHIGSQPGNSSKLILWPWLGNTNRPSSVYDFIVSSDPSLASPNSNLFSPCHGGVKFWTCLEVYISFYINEAHGTTNPFKPASIRHLSLSRCLAALGHTKYSLPVTHPFPPSVDQADISAIQSIRCSRSHAPPYCLSLLKI